MEELIDRVHANPELESATLLNSIIYGSAVLGPPSEPPNWLVGRWLVLQGWSEGGTWLFTAQPHSLHSWWNDEVEKAVGSLSEGELFPGIGELAVGVVRHTIPLRENMVLFFWHMEVGAGMGGIVEDSGWGSLRHHPEEGVLDGIWWYEHADNAFFSGPRANVFYWKLKRVGTA